MSPRAQRRAPACCDANATHGYVLATSASDDAWQVTLVDAVGVTHIVSTDRCPICGAHLAGATHVTVDAWQKESAEDRRLAEAIYKTQAALNAMKRKEE